MTAKNPSANKGTKAIVLIVLFVIAGFLMTRTPEPAWGEPGYRPRIGDDCRAVWASINVDAPRYISTVCSLEEQREIQGYRPAAD